MMIRYLILAALSCLASSPVWAQTDLASDLSSEVATRARAITSNNTSQGRLAALTKMLDDAKVKYRVEPFQKDDHRGENLIVEFGDQSKPTILLGAHFDQVNVGQGAVDNACSCALLMELIKSFQAQPLQNHALEIVFFDLEEAGLVGSVAYVAKHENDPPPRHMLNFDIFGYGDTFWLMSAEANAVEGAKAVEGRVVQAFRQASKAKEIPVVVSGAREYPPGDHLSFVTAGVSTVAIALIDHDEIEKVQQLLSGKRITPPPILRTIHTPDDNFAKVDSKAIAHALPVVEAAVRALDAND